MIRLLIVAELEVFSEYRLSLRVMSFSDEFKIESESHIPSVIFRYGMDIARRVPYLSVIADSIVTYDILEDA